MIEKIKFEEKEVDSILKLLNNTYGYDFEYEESSLDEKIQMLSEVYNEQEYSNSIIKTQNGVGEILLPSELNGTLFMSENSVNMEVKSMGEIFAVEKFQLTKKKKDELGLIIIENNLEDSIPYLVVIE